MFVHINKKVNFTDELKSKYVNSIVFIKDSQEIWTHNTFYAIPEEYKNKILELEQKVGGSFIFLTQEEYDLLGTNIKKDAVYIITNDTPELKIQGPFKAKGGLLIEASTIENYQHYVFKVNNDYFFIYKDESDISLPNDPSLYKQITGNFKILNTEQGKYEYCVPEVVDIESLDDIGMENLLRDTVIVDSFESYSSVAMNYRSRGFYSLENSEYGRFYGFYVYSIPTANISLNSDKGLIRFYHGQTGHITYNFPSTLCTYQIDGTNVLIQQCLNRNNAYFHKYVQNMFTNFKINCNIQEVELIRKSNTLYDKELTAIGKKINLDLNNRLDFGIDSDIIVGKITKFVSRPLNVFYDVKSRYPRTEYITPESIDNTHNIYWIPDGNNYLVLAFRSDKIIPEPTNVVKLRVKNDLSILKYDASKGYHYFPVTIENIENFTDNDVSEFLSNIIVPAIDGIEEDNREDGFSQCPSNPYPHQSKFPKQDAPIYSSNIHTGLKIGKGNPDFTNTYEYRFSERKSTFQDIIGTQYNVYYSPIIVPGAYDFDNYNYSIDDNLKFHVSEVIYTGTYKRLVYNTTIGFNCPSYIIPSLYYYLHLNLKGHDNKVIDSVELIAPSNCKYDTFIKGIEDHYNIDLSNRFSYDEGTISNYMLLYIKTKTMN